MLTSKGESPHEADMGFDPETRIFFIDVSNRRWETEDHVHAHFDRIERLWSQWSGGEKVDMCAGYAGFQFDMSTLGGPYRERGMAIAKKVFRNVARYGLDDDHLLRATQRALAVKTHRPSHIYSSREEAVSVLLGLRTGAVQMAAE